MNNEKPTHSTPAYVGALTILGALAIIGGIIFHGIIITIIASNFESNAVLKTVLLSTPGLIISFLVVKLFLRLVQNKVKEAGEDFDKTDRS